MFINTTTYQYPVSFDAIKKENQHISFPDSIDPQFLSSIGYEPVEVQPYPTSLGRNQYAVLQDPVLVDSKWVQQYQILSYDFNGLVDTNDQPIDPLVAANSFADQIRSQLKKQCAAYRYDVETGGVEVAGAMIQTDRQSQSTVTSAYSAAIINPLVVIDWKGTNGWIQIGSAEITAIATAVSNHVQSCFTKEKLLSEKIDTLADSVLYTFDVETEWNLV